MSRHLGLIIGMNQYEDGAFQPLHFAENDSRALAQWLVNAKGGQWSPPDVQLVQGQYATRELVESLLIQICVHKAEPGDVVLLYFAGHAFVDDYTGEGYLSVTNSRYQDASTNISLLFLTQQIMARSQAAHVLCILDCFQNGQRWSAQRTSPYDSKPLLGSTLLTTLQQLPNRLFLCSCRGNELSAEGGVRNLGLLMHSMIVGFCGPAQNPTDNSVLLPTLHSYLFRSLSEQYRPQLFGQQRPPLTLVGELPVPTITRSFLSRSLPLEQSPTTALPGNVPQSSPIQGTRMGNVLLKSAVSFQEAVPQTPAQSQESQAPFTSGQILSSAINEQRQQQMQQMMGQARQFFQMQNYGAAFSLVEQILRLAPADVDALILKGQLLGLAGRFPEAVAVIDELLRVDSNNPLGWSMRAVALTNLGSHQDALAAIERSLELDARNPETHALKNTIMANLALVQTQTNKHQLSKLMSTDAKRNTPVVFVLGLGLHLLGLFVGLAGFGLLIALRSLPPAVGLLPISVGLTILCVNAARGSFRFGFVHLVLAFLLSVIAAGLLGLAYRAGLTAIVAQLKLHPSLLVPLVLLAAWLAAAAVIPLLLAIGGLISGFVSRARRR